MRVGGKSIVCGLLAGGLIVAALPAHAGIFEQLFGGFGRALQAPRLPDAVREFAAPFEPGSDRAADPSGQVEAGPARAYCVRTCDGHFFPVLAQSGLSAADACHTFCPASQTAIYSGSSIDNAVAANGSRYADLPKAFVYRKQLVAGCTYNGKTAFGLAKIDANDDPTLRPGDVVSTGKGMVVFTGSQNRSARFTPAGNYRNFSKEYRNQLSAMETAAPR